MFIKEIKEYDKISQEADIIVSDGQFEILCYAHPFELKKSKWVLSTLFAENIMISFNKEPSVQKKDGYFDYKLTGKILNKSKQIVSVGEIIIELDGHIPNDLVEGNYIEFECMRIDLR